MGKKRRQALLDGGWTIPGRISDFLGPEMCKWRSAGYHTQRFLFFTFHFILFFFFSTHFLVGETASKAEQTSINVPGQTSYLQKPGYYGGNKGLWFLLNYLCFAHFLSRHLIYNRNRDLGRRLSIPLSVSARELFPTEHSECFVLQTLCLSLFHKEPDGAWWTCRGRRAAAVLIAQVGRILVTRLDHSLWKTTSFSYWLSLGKDFLRPFLKFPLAPHYTITGS